MVRTANILRRLKACGWGMLFSLMMSCDDADGLETRIIADVPPFHIVELNDVFDVYLIQDTVFAIEIRGHEDVIKDVVFKIDTGILRIENNTRAKWMKPENNKVELFIHSDELSAVWPNETCAISTVNPIISKEFRIIMGHHPKLSRIDLELDCGLFLYWNNHQCGGKVTLSGTAKNLNVSSFGLMTIDGRDLVATYATVNNNSKGDVRVRVQNKMEYSIRGVGNIYLYGNPDEIVPREITSTGELIKMD